MSAPIPFMRLATESQPESRKRPYPSAVSAARDSALKLRALPADFFHSMKIQPEIGLSVEHLGHDGIEAHSDRPLTPGGRLSLLFPDSPFLPRPGTVARVERCDPAQNGYHIRLSYEAQSVA